ncbi:bifunctional FCP1 homology domain/Mitochondrial import inner membrane translocase subunit Tim50/HAD-like superfamily/HAD superfamily [Babesia duncani]|uniref:Mitochondrial import inner membrane translocase subunit TIM50 n=1 Tax=Babesia duncani TaxID=323732 RepID=A0AAD9PNR6_9APIC|nr:bifunctional FCP1 homology domain/Mitochondrial import inner membrane translocase subunit Tim50/HAD-like superfamily/HAD superfamily [Babesia duncani]
MVKKCPFCGGVISALLKNKSVEAFLAGINLENYALPTSLDDFVDSSPDGNLETPDYFLFNVPDSIVPLILEHSLLPIYSQSLIHAKLRDHESVDNGPLVFIIAHIGGGTSISLVGIVRVTNVQYMEQFQIATQATFAVHFTWINKVTTPTLVPARKQPIFNYLGGKKLDPVPMNANQKGKDVIWRIEFGPQKIEVGLSKGAFELLVESTFGKAVKITPQNVKSPLDLCFPNGPPPIYMDSNGNVVTKEMLGNEHNVDLQNPYLGYIGILPFLSNGQFQQMRSIQRKAKEQYLSDTTKAIVNSFKKETGEPILEQLYRNICWSPLSNCSFHRNFNASASTNKKPKPKQPPQAPEDEESKGDAYQFVPLGIFGAVGLMGLGYWFSGILSKDPDPSDLSLSQLLDKISQALTESLDSLFPNDGAPLLPDFQELNYPPNLPTLVIDLDKVVAKLEYDRKVGWQVKKRPYADQFFKELVNYYELVIWSDDSYPMATDVANRWGLPVIGCIHRDQCKPYKGGFIKDLNRLGRNLNRVILLDHDKTACLLHEPNTILIREFDGDESDTELLYLIDMLKSIAMNPQDVRKQIKQLGGE